jgi:WD40 repeat protein
VEGKWSRALQTLDGHSGTVGTTAPPPDGSKLASGSDDKAVRVWGVATGQAESTLDDHSDSVSAVVFSPDGNKLDSGQQETTDRSKSRSFYSVDESNHWMTQDGSKILFLPHDHRPGCIAAEDSALAIGSEASRVTIIFPCVYE